MTRHWRFLAFAVLTLAGIGAAAVPAAAQNIPMDFRWDASPLQENGAARTPAAFYEVFLLRGADGEAFAASVEDTTWTLDAEPDVVQRICVRAVDADGNASPFSEWSDPVYFESQGGGGPVPPAPALEPNYPNPFNPETRIVYGVPAGLATGDPMTLEVYTVDGRRVRTLAVDRRAGWHDVVWDGRDDAGQPAAAGLYITRYAAGAMVKTGKMTMVK